MVYVKVRNRSGQQIDLKPIVKKLKPYFGLVEKSKYPIKVLITKKKNFYDRSHFDLNTGDLHLKFDNSQQDQDDMEWVFAHEFAHYLSRHNREIYKTCLHKEHELLQVIFKKVFGLNIDGVHEIFHDFLPAEVFANGFATMVTGKFHKRHPFKNVIKTIKSKFYK